MPVNLPEAKSAFSDPNPLKRKKTLADHTDWEEEEKFSPYTGDRNDLG